MNLYDQLLQKVQADPQIAIRAGYRSSWHRACLKQSLIDKSMTLAEGLMLIRECRDISLIEATLEQLNPQCMSAKKSH